MPRSSKHQSHKQGKHSLKEENDCFSDSEEVVEMKKKKNSSRDESKSARISLETSHSASGDKRKRSSSSQLKDGTDVKNLNRAGGAPEEYVSSKRRKDEIAGGSNGGVDRWIAGGGEARVKEKKKEEEGEGPRVDSEKASRLRESKSSGESKGRSSKRHESEVIKEEIKLRDKENSNERNTNGDLKRDSGRKEEKDLKDMKEKEQESYRDKKKNKGNKQESEFHVANGGVSKKRIDGAADEGICIKREQMIQVEFPNPELKVPEKRIQHREGSLDRTGSQDARENDQRNVASRGNRANDVKYTDDRHKDGKIKEYKDNIPKDDKHKDEKHCEDAETGIKQRDIKHRKNGETNAKRRHEYRDDGERESRRERKYKEDGDKIEKNKGGKHWEDRERDGRRKDDTYRVDSKRAKGSKDDKYHEDVRKDGGHDVKYYEDGDRSGRLKDEKYREESERCREEKHWKDYEDDEHKNGTDRDNFHCDVRIRETKYRDERNSKHHYGDKLDKPAAKYVKEESQPSEVYSRKSRTKDNRSNYDDGGRQNDNKVRKTTPDKEDQQHRDPGTDRGRSEFKNAVERTLNHSRYRESHSSSFYSARGQNRLLKQDKSNCGEYTNGDKVRPSVFSTREYISSQLNEKAIKKDDLHMVDLANERHLKSNIQNAPGQPIGKSPSSTTGDWKWNLDGEEDGQKGVGSKEANAYFEKEGRGTHELAAEIHVRDESSRGYGDTCSMPSPFSRNTHLYSSSNSLVPSPPDRGGIDNPLAFRSSEGDRRIKFDNHQRRMNDPCMSRGAGSPWNFPNWTPPVTNGYMPFQPCAPPFGFHPMLPQFPGPPICGLRPMNFNHPGIQFPIPEADRFTTRHGHTMRWRYPSDDVCPPRLHGQETNNASLSRNSHIFGSPDWNHGILHGDQPPNTGCDVWTSLNTDTNLEFPSKSEKTNSPYSSCAEDSGLTCQPGQVAKNEQILSNLESVDASQSSDVVHEKLPVAFEDTCEEILYTPKVSQKNNLQLCQVYLSVLDISADLTDPETYRNCTNLQNVDEIVVSDAEDWHKHIFYVGVKEVAETREKNPSNFLDGSLFSTISDSLFKKAMSLYLKQKGKLDRSPAKQSSFEEVVGSTIDDILIEKCDEPVAPAIPCRSEDDTNHINMQEEVYPLGGCALENYPPVKSEVMSNGYSPGRNVLPADHDQNQCQVFPVSTTKVGHMLLSDVSSSKACEFVGCESVNLSRIHHSPESTR